MVKRKRRLKKGIVSISEQIKIHEEKEKKAKEEGNIELVGYYEKEIVMLKKTKKRKEQQLEKT